MTTWIKCSDQMPSVGRCVLAWIKRAGRPTVAIWSPRFRPCGNSAEIEPSWLDPDRKFGTAYWPKAVVSHWAELPPAPGEVR